MSVSEGVPDPDDAVPAFATVGTDPEESVNMMTWHLSSEPASYDGNTTATVIAAGDAPVLVVHISEPVPSCAVPPAGTVTAAVPDQEHWTFLVHAKPVVVTEVTRVS